MRCYPSCMVPYTGLNPGVKVDELLEYGDFAVARRVDKEFSSEDIKRMSDNTCIVRGDSTLRGEILGRIPNLSTTMVRNAYPIQVAQFDVKMNPQDDHWEGGLVNVCSFRGRVFKPKVSYLMVYRVKQIHRQPVNYQRKFESKKEAELIQKGYKDLENDIITNKFTRSKFYKGIGHIWLAHSPTKLNYWHFELKLETSEGEFIENAKYKPVEDKTQRNMKQSFIEYVWDNFLYKHFWINTNPCEKDLALSCFFDDNICCTRRWIAAKMTNCLFELVPIVIDRAV